MSCNVVLCVRICIVLDVLIVMQISYDWLLAEHILVVCVSVASVCNDPRMVLLYYIVECTVVTAFTA